MPPNEDLVHLMVSLLGLSSKAKEDKGAIENVKPDIFLRDGKNSYIINVAGVATLEKLSMLTLLKDMMKDGKAHYFLAAKVFPTTVLGAAKKAGIGIVKLPRSVSVGEDASEGRIATEKAWKVASRLLMERVSSIRQLALKENLSYGWAHATTKRLISRGMAVQRGNVVEMTDAGKLLDAVLWERPMKDMEMGRFKTRFTSSYEAAETLTRTCGEWGIDIAFTAYTAASLYTGYAARHDAAYCYVKDKTVFKEIREEMSGGGVELVCYLPDRNVFASTRDVEGIRAASPEQTLLDMAGLGYSARDFTNDVVKRYARIAEVDG